MKRILTISLILIANIAVSQTVLYKGTAEKLSIIKPNPRIAVYDLSALETVHALNGNIVGVAKASVFADLISLKDSPNIEDIGGLTKPNIQKIQTIKPDLIIISGRQRSAADSLSQIAPVLDVSATDLEELERTQHTITILGKILGKEVEAEKLVHEFKGSMTKFQQQARAFNQSEALMLMYINGKLVGFPSKSRFGFIHDVLGFKESNIEMDASARSNPLSDADILNANPKYIFVFDRGQISTDILADKEKIETDLIKKTKAYQEGNFIYLNPRLWYLVGSGPISSPKMAAEVLGPIK